MAGLDYLSIARDASQAIREAGVAMALLRKSGDTFDPVEGTVSGGAVSSITVQGVVLPSLSGWPSPRDTSLVEPGDLFILIDPLTDEPLRTDIVVVGGQNYQVVDLERLAPAGYPVLFTIHARP